MTKQFLPGAKCYARPGGLGNVALCLGAGPCRRDVAAPAITAAQAAVSGVVFGKANIDADDGTQSHEPSGVGANGKKFEVDALAGAVLVRSAVQAVPSAAIRRSRGKFRPGQAVASPGTWP